jgi:CRISPR-associated protein Csd1
MSALASLVRAYDRMAARGEVPAYGYSQEKIGFVISLNPDGSVAHAPIDLRRTEGKRKTASLMAVPQPSKRTSGIEPNFLWDKSAYVLGVTAGESMKHSSFGIAKGLAHRPMTDCKPFCVFWMAGVPINLSD